MRYRLGDSEFRLEVVPVDDYRIDARFSEHAHAHVIRRAIEGSDIKILYVTYTMPDVFVRFLLRNGELNSRTYKIPYRPFLGFISCLEEVQIKAELRWIECGF
jgi:hypothetical protein